METRYSVRQAVEMTGIKSYVLRYWEEELNLRIQRNELGHRYYTGYRLFHRNPPFIHTFMNIKELKKRGLQLRAIRDLIPQIARTAPGEQGSKVRLLEGEEEEDFVTESEVVPEEVQGAICEEEEPQDEKILEFQAILERLIAQELNSQNEDEERCRSLDLAIRRQQMARREAAAAQAEGKQGKKHRKNR